MARTGETVKTTLNNSISPVISDFSEPLTVKSINRKVVEESTAFHFNANENLLVDSTIVAYF